VREQGSYLEDSAGVKLMCVKALGVRKGQFEQHGNSADKQELVNLPLFRLIALCSHTLSLVY